MAIMNLAEAEVLRSASVVPLLYSLGIDNHGKVIKEPWFDYDEEGNPCDFGLDDEPLEPTADELRAIDPDSFYYDVAPSQFTETAIRVPEAGRVADFGFKGREYLRRIYDTRAQKVLLKCGRQIEKCERELVNILLPDGRSVNLKNVEVGNEVVALELVNPRHQKFGPDLGTGASAADTTWQFTTDCIVDKRSAGKRKVYRIVTRMGSEVEVGEDHPMLTASGWLCAGELEVKDRIAAARDISDCCRFGAGGKHHSFYIELLGYAIADGGLSGWGVTLTKYNPEIRGYIESLLDGSGNLYKPSKDGKDLVINKREPLCSWLDEDGLLGKRSREKYIPDWVFTDATREETINFIKALWVDCDGSVKQNKPTKWEIVYASTSRKLAEQVRWLLLKFGIPSRIRRNNHPAYRDDPDPDVDQHLVRVETIEGVNKFLSLFTHKDFDIEAVGDSNRDVIPREVVQPLIIELCDAFGFGKRRGRGTTSPMKEHGLRVTLKYPISRKKLKKYIDFFLEYDACEHPAFSKLLDLFESKVIWDEVVEIEDLGEKEVFHLETKRYHNYVSDLLVTHNSTTLGNRLLCYSALTNNFRSLFVAPSAEQAKVFSNDRIKDVIDSSPLISAYTSTKINQAVFFKKFINYSQIRLRYAYLTADRVRGIPADLITVDEIQDILIDNIPIIEQCAFHSKYKLFLYSGTPKSYDNTIEHYWMEFSTQNEWVVPCEHHGTPKDPSSWHWNILDEDNIGKTGLICDKCGKAISASHEHAKWAAMNPSTIDNKDRVTFEGYRIPQIMVQWVDWEEVLQAQEQYSRDKFMNEKLGLSYDSGIRPITRGQLKACCKPEIRLGDIEHFKKLAQGRQVYAGIDWGCHDEETRILTPNGFKYFRDLTDDDKVAQWDPDTRIMSFIKPIARTVKDWDQPLYHFENSDLNMRVTHTHRMRTRTSKKYDWLTETADKTAQRAVMGFVGHVDWEGEEVATFQLPGLSVSSGYSGCRPHTYEMDDWLEFLGYVLSEGGVCLRPSKADPTCRIPYALKISQREIVSPENTKKIRDCMNRMGIPYLELSNPNTGDANWLIKGKQFWHWFYNYAGKACNTKRIPREFLRLSKRQLRILFDALMLGDGSTDKRDGCDSGSYASTSLGLCEDVQELCIRLGLRSKVRLHAPAEGNRKARWVTGWSHGRDHTFNTMNTPIREVKYTGKVYCCTVPTGYIVTERDGCIAYQGNSGEQSSYTVISFGGYFGTGNFTIFWIHRFTGRDLEPERQLDLISQMLTQLGVQIAGTDYGGGFHPNDTLIRRFGPQKIMKYQYNPRQKKKVYWEENLRRFMVHRSEVMSDVFNALKRHMISLPNWDEFFDPYGQDILNIFTEYNERLRMAEYKKAPGKTDDAFHSIVLCLLASIIQQPRPDILAPMQETGVPVDHG